MMTVRFRKMFLPLILLGAASALYAADVITDAPGGVVTVWDGDTANKGGGWTQPKSDDVTVKPSDTANKGKKSIEFHASGSDWMGFGWNWHGWYPSDAGTDISGCDRMRFFIKITGAAKPADFNIHLKSNNNLGTPDVSIAKYATDKDKVKIDDGEWHEIVIPLKEMYGEKTDFDPKKAWEMEAGEWSAQKVDFSVFFDMVQFLPADK